MRKTKWQGFQPTGRKHFDILALTSVIVREYGELRVAPEDPISIGTEALSIFLDLFDVVGHRLGRSFWVQYRADDISPF